MEADIILVSGSVHSMDKRIPFATALGVRDGQIVAVGLDDEVLALRGAKTEVIDLKGRSVLPGFTDSHIHLVGWALQRRRVDLWGVPTLDEALARIKAQAERLPPGAWLRGGGWDPNIWGRLPTRRELDAVVPDRPVALDSKDWHSLWVNSYTLKLAGITAHTPVPSGGIIARHSGTGEPTGLLKETARDLVTVHYPASTPTDWVHAVREAQPALWAEGITAVHAICDRPDMRNFRTLQILRQEGELGLRAHLYLPAERQPEAIALGLRSGFGDRYLRIGGIKYFADGTLGSRTAAMLSPFDGEPDNSGIMVTDPEELSEGIRAASRAGLAVAVHAIGDRANREVLNILEVVRDRESTYGRPALPHRIEHVQVLHPDDVHRLAALDVAASMQPIHATQDMSMAERYWGRERVRLSYAWRSILRTGALLVFGSDAPVEQPSVVAGLHAALTRRRADGSPGPEGWVPAERMCPRPALHAYTLAPAVLEGTQSWRGSLYPGKVADLVVLNGNVLDTAREDPMAVLEMRVDLTMFEGQVVMRRD